MKSYNNNVISEESILLDIISNTSSLLEASISNNIDYWI